MNVVVEDDKSGVLKKEEEYSMDDVDLKAPDLAAFAEVFARFQLPEDSNSVRPTSLENPISL